MDDSKYPEEKEILIAEGVAFRVMSVKKETVQNKTKGPQAKVPKPIQIPHIKETHGDSLDSPKVKKRRKSIVDILFPKQHSSLSSTPPETPPVIACKNNASFPLCEVR